MRLALPSGEAMVYLMGLGGICAVDYIVFSITTLYYIGYFLLVAYFIFSLLWGLGSLPPPGVSCRCRPGKPAFRTSERK